MNGRQDMFAGTGEVRPQHRIDVDRLASYIAGHVPGFTPPLTIEQFRGGQSNPTYRLRDGAGRLHVLRRKPPGTLLKSAHAVEREYRVVSALGQHGGVPVPTTLALCEDAGVIGTAFYIMDHVDGRIFWDADIPGVDKDERAALFDAMNATIAALHRVDPAATGLTDFGKPDNYFARQISRWSRQYLDDGAAGRIAAMDRLVAWLPEHIPPGEETAIVHGDFRIDNLIFHKNEPCVVAILDWELSTLGHPLADFSYHLMMYRMPPTGFAGLAGADTAALGIPDEDSYMRRYCARVGRPEIGKADLAFYMAFNMFRLAAILHGIAGRVQRGTAASPAAARQAAMCEPLAELAWSQVSDGAVH